MFSSFYTILEMLLPRYRIICFSTRNVEASPQNVMWMGQFLHFFSIYFMHKFAYFHKNKIHARVVLEMAVCPALSSVILILLIGKLHSFHRWSWFLRWGSKSPLIILVKIKWPPWPNSKSFAMKDLRFLC